MYKGIHLHVLFMKTKKNQEIKKEFLEMSHLFAYFLTDTGRDVIIDC